VLETVLVKVEDPDMDTVVVAVLVCDNVCVDDPDCDRVLERVLV